jgi:hypothetical protein
MSVGVMKDYKLTLSWTIRRSRTIGTGSAALARYPGSSMSPQWWSRLLMTCCVFTLCVVRKRSGIWSTIQSYSFFEFIMPFWHPSLICLLLIDKSRVKDKTYIHQEWFHSLRGFRQGFCSISLKTVSVRFEFCKLSQVVLLCADGVVNYRKNHTAAGLSGENAGGPSQNYVYKS